MGKKFAYARLFHSYGNDCGAGSPTFGQRMDFFVFDRGVNAELLDGTWITGILNELGQEGWQLIEHTWHSGIVNVVGLNAEIFEKRGVKPEHCTGLPYGLNLYTFIKELDGTV